MISGDNLRNKMKMLDIELNSHQIDQFSQYYDLLCEKNKVMNLTSITQPEEVIDKHFIDSLSLVRAFKPESGRRVIDVGTGAGFPGIPLKIVFPDLKITLLDSLAKRVGFLNEVIEALELTDIEAVHSRAEDAAHNDLYRQQYDLCVSRAVASLPVLLEYCLPFVKTGGCFVAYKAGDTEQETEQAKRALGMLGGALGEHDSISFMLPDTDYARTLLKIHKIKDTPKRYPRKAGMPSKKPL